MKVKELIAKLEQLDSDLEVFFNQYNCNDCYYLSILIDGITRDGTTINTTEEKDGNI